MDSNLQYEIAIIFHNNSLNKDVVDITKFRPKDHSFEVHMYDRNIPIHPIVKYKKGWQYGDEPSQTIPVEPGCYFHWATYYRSKPVKWENRSKQYRPSEGHQSSKVIQAHLFFKTHADFVLWLGEANYNSLFAEML